MTATASPRNKKPHRRLRRLGYTAAILAGLLLVSTFANLAMYQAERSATAPYGQKVQTSHGALNVVRTPGNGRTGQSVVLLSGLGTPAPALDFAPLVRQLGDYDVVVVEGFGYGYSDQPAVERTVENNISELHEALANAGVPGPMSWPAIPSPVSTRSPYLAPSLVEPGGNAYTSRERDQMRKMAIWNFGNPYVVDETNRIADNARKVQEMLYPDDLPVLTLLASAKETPADSALHESRLQNVRRHETVTLPGGHYLHWTNAPAIASKINAFVTTNTR